MSDPEITVDAADGQLLVGVQTDDLAAAASLGPDADLRDVEDAMADLEAELRHSARIDWRGSA